MKKVLCTLFTVFALSGIVFAGEAVTKGYISVDTQASAEIDPTIVKISFAIINDAKSAEEASTLNKQTSQRALDAVKSLVDTQKQESIKTSSFNLHPNYTYKDGVRRLINYSASNTLEVTLRDTSKAGKVIAAALSNGANSVNGLNFILEETNDECNKLIQKAAAGAKERADKIAASMGTTVTGIKSINAGCSTNQSFASNFRVMNAKAEMEDAAVSSGSMPVEAGKTKLRANVSADFFVK